ncbi:hypothetical protein AtubIFM55763_002675 [Aspergillus tubingensis]|uniref:Uncharacterized protein n=1 Tax=Aspergillus tubingensis TaxID=5068 RepID=A0A9W6AX45_ASPTU|nr:hypothetical protein AtubIFM54640_001442 [Aspergillus tubingensis]GLA72153.1 hypothetical protein AtubIFM55763_002675 [Aspergillus tubingensis]GLA89072.1 hypothetical protein AtubIFM56815_003544 [Aspergillus tubingensis]
MPSPSSISLSTSLLTAGYLAFRGLTPPNLPSSSKGNGPPDRVRLLTGSITTIILHLNTACIIYHALLALFYIDRSNNNAKELTKSGDGVYLQAICPHRTSLAPHLFTWTITSTLCLVSIIVGALLRLSAFKSLGRNFTFQLAQPNTLVTGATGTTPILRLRISASPDDLTSSSSGSSSALLSFPSLPSTHSPPLPNNHSIAAPDYTMGILKRAAKITTIGAGLGTAFFFAAVRHNTFVPMPTTDPLFQHPLYQKLNPNNNPTTHDLCVRRVPLKDIKPALLEKPGRLTEAFCAGVWSGFGYAYQRRYLSKKYEGPETASHLWTRADLRAATYDVGTLITDHFEVVEKTPERIVVRCGDSPRKKDVRESDGLFEISTEVKPQEGVAEFRLKSLFFQGKGKAESEPMPSHVVWLHQQYTKLWLETALGNIWR